jgi:hypothetical protein
MLGSQLQDSAVHRTHSCDVELVDVVVSATEPELLRATHSGGASGSVTPPTTHQYYGTVEVSRERRTIIVCALIVSLFLFSFVVLFLLPGGRAE